VEELIDNLLELRGPNVLGQIERSAERVSLGAQQLAHDASAGIDSGSENRLGVHPTKFNRTPKQNLR